MSCGNGAGGWGCHRVTAVTVSRGEVGGAGVDFVAAGFGGAYPAVGGEHVQDGGHVSGPGQLPVAAAVQFAAGEGGDALGGDDAQDAAGGFGGGVGGDGGHGGLVVGGEELREAYRPA